MTTRVEFVIQTNQALYKYGVYDLREWKDYDAVTQLDSAKSSIDTGLPHHTRKDCHGVIHSIPINKTNLRIIRREITETVIES